MSRREQEQEEALWREVDSWWDDHYKGKTTQTYEDFLVYATSYFDNTPQDSWNQVDLDEYLSVFGEGDCPHTNTFDWDGHLHCRDCGKVDV